VQRAERTTLLTAARVVMPHVAEKGAEYSSPPH
jgi:hypothetical protein